MMRELETLPTRAPMRPRAGRRLEARRDQRNHSAEIRLQRRQSAWVREER